MSTVQNSHIVTDGLVLCLDAANPRSYVSGSGVWRDLTGNTTSGSLINGPTYDPANGGSVLFDGVNDYADFGRFSTIEAIPSITMCAWVKTVNVTTNLYPWIINTWFPQIVFVVYQFAMNVSDTTYISASPAASDSINRSMIPLNTWMHVCGTYDGNRCRLYWNGVLMGTSTVANGVTPTGVNSLIMGRSSAGGISYSNVYIANVSIYTKTLSQTEILQNYNASKARFGLT